jgi:hypothetical protein
MGAENESEPATLSELAVPDKVSHNVRADYRTEQLRGQRFPLPSVQDCYHCANRCLDMWKDSAEHTAQSSLLRMADAWLQLASESDKRL